VAQKSKKKRKIEGAVGTLPHITQISIEVTATQLDIEATAYKENSRNMASNSAMEIASLWVEGDWWAWCSADVVDAVVTHLALNCSGASEVRKLGENAVDCH
jgi:hypothetical protein